MEGDEPGLVSDAAAIVRSQVEPAEFAVLFDRHFVTIHRYVSRRIGPDGADDLSGEVFRIAFERRHGFDPRWASARPWLYGIATNLLRGQYRSEERRLRALRRVVAVTPVSTNGEEFDRADARIDAEVLGHSIGFAVSQLTPGDRDALILFAVEGLSYAEVAAALDIPVGTVRSRISRARTRLRELLDAPGQQRDDWPETEDESDG